MNYGIIALAIAAGVLVNMVMGMLWYSSLLFGTQWQHLTGIHPEKSPKPMAMVTVMLMGVVQTAFMICFMYRFNLTTLVEGFHFGWMLGVGFVATTLMYNVIFERRPFLLFLIDSGFSVITLALMGMVLSLLVNAMQ
jgi:hypothetical protein